MFVQLRVRMQSCSFRCPDPIWRRSGHRRLGRGATPAEERCNGGGNCPGAQTDRPQIHPGAAPDRPEIDQKTTRDQPQTDPRPARDRPQMDARSISHRPQLGTRSQPVRASDRRREAAPWLRAIQCASIIVRTHGASDLDTPSARSHHMRRSGHG